MLMRVKLWFFVAFIALQGLFPVWAVIGEDHVISTDFTWDMFAVRRDCSSCEIRYFVGGGPPQRISWGLRSPRLMPQEPPEFTWWNGPTIPTTQIDALTRFEVDGRNALLAHPSMPAINVRAAPQVARLKSTNRLRRVGADLCEDLETLFQQALAGEPAPQWAARDAARWEQRGRALRVSAECECGYNNAPTIALIDPEENLCADDD